MNKKQIMIIEDKRVVADDIKNRIQNLGYHVSAILSTGEEAIKMAKESKPDLILMDTKLDGNLDGIEAADQIRSHTEIPIVFLTASANEDALKRAKLAKPFGFIVKPFDDSQLQGTLEIALHLSELDMKSRERSEKQIEDLKKELKRQHVELIQSERMASLGYILSGVALKINDPLAYIKSNTEFIENGLKELKEGCEENGDYLEKLGQIAKLTDKNLKGIHEITYITKSLQKFSKRDKGEMYLADINQGIEDVLTFFEGEYKDRVKLKKHMGNLPKIVCNLEQLKDAFMKILLKSYRFLDFKEMIIKTSCENDYVRIEIEHREDVSTEKRAHEIRTSSHLEGIRNPEHGLDLCYEIIKEHKGEIKIESNLGVGSKVTIRLPI
jgi:CheY-like chemotaxis protein